MIKLSYDVNDHGPKSKSIQLHTDLANIDRWILTLSYTDIELDF